MSNFMQAQCWIMLTCLSLFLTLDSSFRTLPTRTSRCTKSSAELWHSRLGHLSHNRKLHVIKDSLSLSDVINLQKYSFVTYFLSQNREGSPFLLVITDPIMPSILFGALADQSWCSHWWEIFTTIVDDHTRFVWHYGYAS